jgi:hypothetical protein
MHPTVARQPAAELRVSRRYNKLCPQCAAARLALVVKNEWAFQPMTGSFGF